VLDSKIFGVVESSTDLRRRALAIGSSYAIYNDDGLSYLSQSDVSLWAPPGRIIRKRRAGFGGSNLVRRAQGGASRRYALHLH
jgi:hypothetical protein